VINRFNTVIPLHACAHGYTRFWCTDARRCRSECRLHPPPGRRQCLHFGIAATRKRRSRLWRQHCSHTALCLLCADAQRAVDWLCRGGGDVPGGSEQHIQSECRVWAHNRNRDCCLVCASELNAAMEQLLPTPQLSLAGEGESTGAAQQQRTGNTYPVSLLVVAPGFPSEERTWGRRTETAAT
jgi:hypothetical protein